MYLSPPVHVIVLLIYTLFSGCVASDPSTTPANDAANTTIVPIPTVPVYSVKDGTNICLMVQMNLKFTIYYFNTKGEKIPVNFFLNSTTVDLPIVNGTCSPDTQTLTLQWFPEKFKPSWFLSMQFSKSATQYFSLDIMVFNFTVTAQLFPDTNEIGQHFTLYNASQFRCPLGSYFQCQSKQTSKLTEVPLTDHKQTTQLDVFVTVSNLRAEAFRTSPDPTFVGSMAECSADYVPNKVVPIVVGIALALMIIVALTTFIIASRRRQSGYQTI